MFFFVFFRIKVASISVAFRKKGEAPATPLPVWSIPVSLHAFSHIEVEDPHRSKKIQGPGDSSRDLFIPQLEVT